MKKKFNDQVAKWHEEEKNIPDDAGALGTEAAKGEEEFKVDVRLYKERDDDYCIMGNKLQYRACEQNEEGRNYVNKQAMETKGTFDPIRIRLRIKPVSEAPLAQGKSADYYFIQGAKKALSGDLPNAIE